MSIHIRPMTLDDVDAVTGVVEAADAAAERAKGRVPAQPSDERQAFVREATARFVRRDPGGSWVADDSGTVVGMAEAVRRDGFWGLSMLFVHPDAQSRGIGRRLLDAALTHAEGAGVRMILTSLDPRALRRYSRAGLAVHPVVEAEGAVDRGALPAEPPGRTADASDLDLVAEVDGGLRGSRVEDVEFLLASGARMWVADRGPARGYVVTRDGPLLMLGATDEVTASGLLWRYLAETPGKASVWHLTAQQDWAVRVALDARLSVVPAGPLFVSGLDRPPGPWIPSGWYF
ncbi:MAG: GNAT family N-acetyltransferase [Kineosporiaceae bacterium]